MGSARTLDMGGVWGLGTKMVGSARTLGAARILDNNNNDVECGMRDVAWRAASGASAGAALKAAPAPPDAAHCRPLIPRSITENDGTNETEGQKQQLQGTTTPTTMLDVV